MKKYSHTRELHCLSDVLLSDWSDSCTFSIQPSAFQTSATFGSPRRNFNSWEEICSREELGRRCYGWKKCWFLLLVYLMHKNCTTVLCFRWNCLQYAKTRCFKCGDCDWRHKIVCWFIIVGCFFAVDRWKCYHYLFCDFFWGEICSVCVCKGGISKILWELLVQHSNLHCIADCTFVQFEQQRIFFLNVICPAMNCLLPCFPDN